MDDRLRAVIDIIGIDELVRRSEIGSTRWRTVRYDKRTRISTQEVQAIVKIKPEYTLWINLGLIAPEAGQTSPEYDEANKNLPKPAKG